MALLQHPWAKGAAQAGGLGWAALGWWLQSCAAAQPCHGPAARADALASFMGKARAALQGSAESQLLAPGRARGTCAVLREQAGVSHWLLPVCLELVQAQPTSLESWRGWAGSALLPGLPRISVSGR